MNTYLKIDAELPSGLDYLDLKVISIPNAILGVGKVISAFNFTGGFTRDIINRNSHVVGAPELSTNGVLLGKSGWINTRIEELPEFTLLAVLKPITMTNDLAISTFANEKTGADEKPTGMGMAPTRIHARQASGNMGTQNFNPIPLQNNFAIIAMSRDKGGIVACSRVSGETGTITANCTPDVQKSTPFGIGYTENAILAGPDYHSEFLYTAIHSKALSALEIRNYVDTLAAELNLSN